MTLVQSSDNVPYHAQNTGVYCSKKKNQVGRQLSVDLSLLFSVLVRSLCYDHRSLSRHDVLIHAHHRP